MNFSSRIVFCRYKMNNTSYLAIGGCRRFLIHYYANQTHLQNSLNSLKIYCMNQCNYSEHMCKILSQYHNTALKHSFMEILCKFHVIYFENFMQFLSDYSFQVLREFHASFKWISSFYQFLRELFSIIKKISLSFWKNFT